MPEISPFYFAKRFPSLVKNLSEQQVQRLLDSLDVQEYEAGEAVICEGTETNSLFLVWDGELNVVQDTVAGEHHMTCIQPGSFLGEVELLDPGLALATVRSEQGCTVLQLPRSNLISLWDEYPEIASAFLAELLQTMANRIQGINVHLGHLMAEETQLPDDMSRAEVTKTVTIAHS